MLAFSDTVGRIPWCLIAICFDGNDMGEEERAFITPQINKRAYRRATLVTEVSCEATGRAAMLVTRDISAGGIFVTAKTLFSEGSEVRVSLRLAADQSVLTLHGKVVHSLPGTGMGIEFQNIEPTARESLEKFVDEAR